MNETEEKIENPAVSEPLEQPVQSVDGEEDKHRRLKAARNVAVVILTWAVGLGMLLFALLVKSDTTSMQRKMELMSEQNKQFKNAKPLEDANEVDR